MLTRSTRGLQMVVGLVLLGIYEGYKARCAAAPREAGAPKPRASARRAHEAAASLRCPLGAAHASAQRHAGRRRLTRTNRLRSGITCSARRRASRRRAARARRPRPTTARRRSCRSSGAACESRAATRRRRSCCDGPGRSVLQPHVARGQPRSLWVLGCDARVRCAACTRPWSSCSTCRPLTTSLRCAASPGMRPAASLPGRG